LVLFIKEKDSIARFYVQKNDCFIKKEQKSHHFYAFALPFPEFKKPGIKKATSPPLCPFAPSWFIKKANPALKINHKGAKNTKCDMHRDTPQGKSIKMTKF
jgi:hypothetical protein